MPSTMKSVLFRQVKFEYNFLIILQLKEQKQQTERIAVEQMEQSIWPQLPQQQITNDPYAHYAGGIPYDMYPTNLHDSPLDFNQMNLQQNQYQGGEVNL